MLRLPQGPQKLEQLETFKHIGESKASENLVVITARIHGGQYFGYCLVQCALQCSDANSDALLPVTLSSQPDS